MRVNRDLFGNIPIHETLQIASLLAMVGGFVDTYTYITRGGVFAYAATGNIIFFAISLVSKDFFKAGYYLIPIILFFLGVLLTEFIKKRYISDNLIKWEHIVLIFETVFLFLVGFLPASFPNFIVVMIIAFISSVQMTSFKKLEGMSYVTNMCTGNLRQATEYLSVFLSDRDKESVKKSSRYFFVILSFIFGAFLGAFLTGIFYEKSIWICSVMLICVELVMFFGR